MQLKIKFVIFVQTVPEHWIPATDVPIVGGQPQPDQSRHIPGKLTQVYHQVHCTDTGISPGTVY